MSVVIHQPQDFEKMRAAGNLAAEILDFITDYVDVGVATEHLDALCHQKIIASGAIPAPLGYKPAGFVHPFPKSICTSVNEAVCHGVPCDYKLKDGDIVNIDVTVILDGWHGDSSRMYFAGNPGPKAKKLVQTTYDCMMFGIEQAKPGNKLGDIGYAIQSHAEKNGFSVVREYCGHGIGKKFHAEPSVLHYGKKGSGEEIVEGMFFTVEPMINENGYKTRRDELLRKKSEVLYEWTVITGDISIATGKRSLSAQFEHTIGIGKNGAEIFTKSPKQLDFPKS